VEEVRSGPGSSCDKKRGSARVGESRPRVVLRGAILCDKVAEEEEEEETERPNEDERPNGDDKDEVKRPIKWS